MKQVEVWLTYIDGREPLYMMAGAYDEARDRVTVTIPWRMVDLIVKYVEMLWGIAILEPGTSGRAEYEAERELIKWPGGCYTVGRDEMIASPDDYGVVFTFVAHQPEVEIVGVTISRPDNSTIRWYGDPPPRALMQDETLIYLTLAGPAGELWRLFKVPNLFDQPQSPSERVTYEILRDERFRSDCQVTILDHLVAMGLVTEEQEAFIKGLPEQEEVNACA